MIWFWLDRSRAKTCTTIQFRKHLLRIKCCRLMSTKSEITSTWRRHSSKSRLTTALPPGFKITTVIKMSRRWDRCLSRTSRMNFRGWMLLYRMHPTHPSSTSSNRSIIPRTSASLSQVNYSKFILEPLMQLTFSISKLSGIVPLTGEFKCNFKLDLFAAWEHHFRAADLSIQSCNWSTGISKAVECQSIVNCRWWIGISCCLKLK